MKLSMTRILTVAMLACAVPCFAANVVIPNGAFTNPSDDGTIGGLLAGTGSATIGGGPWTGTYNAVLGILGAPTLNIHDDPSVGEATISGLLGGTNLLGDTVDTSGWFQQYLVNGYVPNTVYTLQANVEAGAVLSVSALDNFGAGIALLNGSNVTASSTSSALVNVVLLSGDTYQVTLQYTTGATAPTGNLGVRLFDAPSGLLTAGLLQNVEFSNVTLDASPVGAPTPEPGAFLLAGLGLVAMTRVRKLRRG